MKRIETIWKLEFNGVEKLFQLPSYNLLLCSQYLKNISSWDEFVFYEIYATAEMSQWVKERRAILTKRFFF